MLICVRMLMITHKFSHLPISQGSSSASCSRGPLLHPSRVTARISQKVDTLASPQNRLSQLSVDERRNARGLEPVCVSPQVPAASCGCGCCRQALAAAAAGVAAAAGDNEELAGWVFQYALKHPPPYHVKQWDTHLQGQHALSNRIEGSSQLARWSTPPEVAHTSMQICTCDAD
jgi:hypothetical protein